MRLLNVGDIKVGDWIEWWCDRDKTWKKSETPVEKVKNTGWGELCVWWDGGSQAWPIKQCRKVKGPDETTERRTC